MLKLDEAGGARQGATPCGVNPWAAFRLGAASLRHANAKRHPAGSLYTSGGELAPARALRNPLTSVSSAGHARYQLQSAWIIEMETYLHAGQALHASRQADTPSCQVWV